MLCRGVEKLGATSFLAVGDVFGPFSCGMWDLRVLQIQLPPTWPEAPVQKEFQGMPKGQVKMTHLVPLRRLGPRG